MAKPKITKIIFRVWNRNKKKWLDDDRIYIRRDGLLLINTTLNERSGMWMLDGNPLSISRHTGMKDKNKKEIFENDILNYSYFCSDENKRISEIGKVLWKNGGFYVSYLDELTPIYEFLKKYLQDEETVIIGNIYENPELIK